MSRWLKIGRNGSLDSQGCRLLAWPSITHRGPHVLTLLRLFIQPVQTVTGGCILSRWWDHLHWTHRPAETPYMTTVFKGFSLRSWP